MDQVPNPDQTAQPTTGMSGRVGGAGNLFAPQTSDGEPGAKPDLKVQLKAQLNPIKLSPEQIAEWFDRIKKSEQRRKDQEAKWDLLLKEYMPAVSASGESEDPKVNTHFRNTHTKIGQLFVRSPEIRLTPEGPAIEPVQTINPVTQLPEVITAEKAVFIKQSVINKFMGPTKIDGLRLMDECLFDNLAWSGISAVKVGYRCVHKPVQEPVMGPDPNWQPQSAPPGSLLGLSPQVPPQVPQMGPDGQPMTRTVNVPVHEEWYANRLTAKKLLLDETLKSSRHNKLSRWKGMDFFISKRMALREFGLDEGEISGGGASDDRVHEFKEQGSGGKAETDKDMIHGYEIWFYGAEFLDDELNPDVVYQLTLLEKVKDHTIVCRRSPDQDVDEYGKLTPDSLVGLPILVGCLRDLADSPHPPSDAAFVQGQAKGINTHRRQSVKIRDAQIGKYLYDTDAIDKTDLDAIRNGEVGEFIGLKGGALNGGQEKVIIPLNQVKSTADDWRIANQMKADMDETLGIDATTSGSPLSSVHSATEIATFSANSQGRQKKEQARAIAFYLEIVRMVDKLLVRYATNDDYVSWEGADGAKQLTMWNNQIIAGDFAYDIKPDSQLEIDASKDRQQKISFYNIAAADPLFNRAVVLRDIARDFGYDPAKIVLSPEAQMAQPPHGGGPVNKHQQEASGGRPNAPGASTREERAPAPASGARPTGPQPSNPASAATTTTPPGGR